MHNKLSRLVSCCIFCVCLLNSQDSKHKEWSSHNISNVACLLSSSEFGDLVLVSTLQVTSPLLLPFQCFPEAEPHKPFLNQSSFCGKLRAVVVHYWQAKSISSHGFLQPGEQNIERCVEKPQSMMWKINHRVDTFMSSVFQKCTNLIFGGKHTCQNSLHLETWRQRPAFICKSFDSSSSPKWELSWWKFSTLRPLCFPCLLLCEEHTVEIR